LHKRGIIIKLRFFTFLTLAFYANLCLALGLGDIDLRSNLGEKLLATVIVSDIEMAPDSSCFTASDTSDNPALKKANISLKPNGSNHTLTISTNNVISEPIVNLRVSFHCEPNVNRDYVLLLDPLSTPGIEKSVINNVAIDSDASNNIAIQANNQTHPTTNKNVRKQSIDQSTDELTTEPPAFKRKAKKKKSRALSSIDQKLLEAYTGKQIASEVAPANSTPENHSAPTTTDHRATSDKPFLVISGGDPNSGANANKPNLSLLLATEIDISRPDEPIAPIASTDAMDEVTVMANRLAHLEKQITSLQTRNAQLVAESEKIKEEKAKLDWLKIIAIGLGVILALVAAEILRRKISTKSASLSETWFDAEKSQSTSNDSSVFPPISFNRSETRSPELAVDSSVERTQTSNQNSGFANIESLAILEKDDHNSVLDDADVFIEHGRPILAVQLLQNHLSEYPDESPAIWLKLLNLLAKESTETEYDEAVVECNKHFNIKAAKFGNTASIDNSSIEDYPHIISRLEGVWGSPYAIGFLKDLIYNKRSQPREGLDQGAFDDLFFLQYIAKRLESSNPYSQKNDSEQKHMPTAGLANVEFNDALFTDIEPVEQVKTEKENIPNFHNTETNKPFADKLSASLNLFRSDTSPFPIDPSYEVSMITEDEATLNESSAPELDFSAKHQQSKIDDSPITKEIDSSLDVERLEYISSKSDQLLNDELVLDDKPSKVLAHNLESTLEIPKSEVLADKFKTKTKSSPTKKAESNEIEWDLPEINSKTNQ
jgi:hypothetical protein